MNTKTKSNTHPALPRSPFDMPADPLVELLTNADPEKLRKWSALFLDLANLTEERNATESRLDRTRAQINSLLEGNTEQ